MSPSAVVGEQVYVPVARIDAKPNTPFALVRGPVQAVMGRSVVVSLPYGIGQVTVASSLIHKDVGVCVLRIGDMETEDSLLNPIAKSVLQYLRLLVPDDQVTYVALRTREELYALYAALAPSFTHFVIVGHGADGDLILSCGQRESGTDLAANFFSRCAQPRKFISLCCNTGRAEFAKSFSQSACCEALVAPFGTLHGAVATQFLQTFFGYHFLEGRTFRTAFKNARIHVSGGATFRIWTDGEFEGRPA